MKKALLLLLVLTLLCASALAEEERVILDPRDQPALAISFDDGPSRYTPQVLDILAENDCRATFFMVGDCMENHPEMVRAVYESGNEVGLYAYHHDDLTQMAADAVVSNLQKCQSIVTEQTGATAKWLRPPFGRVGSAAYDACREMDMYIATWSIDSWDWSLQNAEKSIKRLWANCTMAPSFCFMIPTGPPWKR